QSPGDRAHLCQGLGGDPGGGRRHPAEVLRVAALEPRRLFQGGTGRGERRPDRGRRDQGAVRLGQADRPEPARRGFAPSIVTARRLAMTRVRVLQLAFVGAVIILLEVLCRLGIINRFTMIPPSEMALALGHVVATAPWFWPDVSYTLGNLAAAIALSVVG